MDKTYQRYTCPVSGLNYILAVPEMGSSLEMHDTISTSAGCMKRHLRFEELKICHFCTFEVAIQFRFRLGLVREKYPKARFHASDKQWAALKHYL